MARGDVEVPNDDLVGPIDSSDEWIRQRTGITSRRRASAEVGVADLAERAAREALATAGLAAADFDVIIVTTVTFAYATPSLAALLGGRLGNPSVVAYDICAA